MSRIRLLLHGEVRDHEALAALTKRMQAFVEEYEPGTLLWECFVDDATGAVVWHEVHASPDAYLAHAQNMVDKGYFDEFVRLVRLDSVSSLERVDDDRVWTKLRLLNAEFLHPVARVDH